MDNAFVAVGKFLGGGLDGVYVAYQVGYRYVWRSQLLRVALRAVQPSYRGVVPVLGDEMFGVVGNRVERIVKDIATSYIRHVFIQKLHHKPCNAGLGLAPQAEQEYIMPREDGSLQLWNNGVVVSQNPPKTVFFIF